MSTTAIQLPTLEATAVAKLHAVARELNDFFIEREDIVHMLMLAWIARADVFIVGVPGTAKTDIAAASAEHIEDCVYREVLLNKFSDVGEVFGGWDFGELKQGRQVRTLDDGIVYADIATIDEVGKGSTAIQNTLLPVMARREYHERGRKVKSKIITLVGCSNELLTGEEQDALADRFQIRLEAKKLSAPGFARFLRSGKRPAPVNKISRAELEALYNLIPADINQMIPDAIFQTMEKLEEDLKNEGFEASARRWGVSRRVLCASAIFDGRTVVNEDDLEVLPHILWSKPQDFNKVNTVINKASNPLKAKAAEMLDNAETIRKALFDTHKDFSSTDATMAGAAAINKLKEVRAELDATIKNNPGANTSRLESARAKVQGIIDEVADKCL